jgi:mono/diheme cytochrome c family protein
VDPKTVGDPAHGAQVYQSAGCTTCHGSNLGGGVGPRLNRIQHLPTTAAGKDLDPDFLISTITNGIPGTQMQPKGGNQNLTDQDIKDLAAFIIDQNLHAPVGLTPGELARANVLWVTIGIISMLIITYLLATYNMRWIARRGGRA